MTSETVESLKRLPHKDGVNREDWSRVHPNLLLLAFFYVQFCLQHELPILFTSIIRPKIPNKSVSNSHAEGRAFDVSVHGWSMEKIKLFETECNDMFKLGAISLKSNKEIEAVYENDEKKGVAPHIHCQCRA